MSGSEQYEQVSVSSDGVTVDKRFEEDEFPVPAIAFEIRSSRSETVTVTIVDDVPADIAVEDLGFHPEYGSEYWSIDENRITFEREIEAGAEYTTVYGIRATGAEDVEKFLSEPRIERVDPPLSGSDDSVVDEESSDVVRDVISGEADAVPGLEDEGSDDEDVETLDLKDPNTPGGGVPSGAGAAAVDAGDGDGDAESASAESLVGAIATELRAGNVDEEDVELLRKAFDLAGDGSGGSVDARIQRLQTDVADLLAYTDALEEFLDENGTAEQTIEGFRGEVESLRSELQEVGELARAHEEALSEVESTVDGVESAVQSLESDIDEIVGEIEAVRSDVDEVSGAVDTVRSDVDEVEGSLGDVEGTVDEMEGTVEEVEGSVDEMEGTVEEVEGTVHEMEGTVEEVEGTVDEMEGTVEEVERAVEGVESEVDSLEAEVSDIDVDGIRREVAEVESDIQDLKEWRDQLSSVIGGGD